MSPPEVQRAPDAEDVEGEQSGDLLGGGVEGNDTPSAGPYARAAERYFDLGWTSPIPVVGKWPPPKGWTGRDGEWPSQADVQAWVEDRGDANVALRLPVDVLGIDVDAYGFKPGAATLGAATRVYGPLPETWISTSRDDGVSGIQLFRVPAGRSWRGQLPQGGGVDVIAWHERYALVAPSVHPEGRVYCWRRPDGSWADPDEYPKPVDLPDLPAAWVAGLEAGNLRDRGSSPRADVGLVDAWLDALPGAAGVVCEHMRDVLGEALTRLPSSRHDVMKHGSIKIIRAGERGHPGVVAALDSLRLAFLAHVVGDGSRSASTAEAEWDRAIDGAVSKIAATPSGPSEVDPCTYRPPMRQDVETLSIKGDEFWDQRAELAQLRDFARARMVSPWALLGVVLVRIVATVPPWVKLPALVGSYGSLNLNVGLVGPSGGGKGAAERAAADAVTLPGEVFTTTPGSGEGIAHLFAKRNSEGEIEALRDSVIFTCPEVDTLTALTNRSASTLMPQFRSAWSGEPLGFGGYVAKDKAIPVPAHTYRLGLIVGIQPGRAGTLINGAESGDPQRFLWLPTTDPAAPDVPPDEPKPIKVIAPGWQMRNPIVSVPKEVEERTRAIRLAALRGAQAQEVGHLNLSRLKVAAALTVLAGRDAMTVDDWDLADHVIAVSEQTRMGVVRYLSDHADVEAERRGKREGIRAAAAEEITDGKAIARVSQFMLRKIPAEGITQKKLRSALASRDRDLFEQAVDALIRTGSLDRQKVGNRVEYRVKGAS